MFGLFDETGGCIHEGTYDECLQYQIDGDGTTILPI